MKAFAIGIVATVAFGLMVWLYGVEQHSKGYKQRDTEAQIEAAALIEQARQKEQAMVLDLEEAYYDAYEQKKLADATIASLTADTASLRSVINSQSKRLSLTGSTTGTDAVSAAAWVALDECVREYAAVAGVADGYVEDLRKGQGWARVVSSSP